MRYALLGLSAALAVACKPAAPSSGVIAGTVVDAAGAPVRGARVALVPMGLFDPSGARLVHADSGADGSFRLDGVGAGRFGVTATAAGHEAACVPDLVAGQSAVRIQLGSGGRRLSGRVIDRSGRPWAGAEVRLARGFGEEGDIFLVESAAQGRWNATVPDGEYHAHAVQAGFAAGQRALPSGRDSVDLVLDPVGPAGPAPAAVVDWFRAHATPVASVAAGHGLADLAPLRAIVGDARVVGLGEATHGTREIFQLKHRMLEFLVSEMDFTVFAIEISLADAFAIDDYVLGGQGDPEKLLAGQFVAVWQTEELRDLVRWMREWNREHARKVRFHGLDMRTGVRAAKEALAYLARVDPASSSEPAVRALALLSDPVDSVQILRGPKPELVALAAWAGQVVDRLDRRRAEYVAWSDPDTWWRAMMQARALVQMLTWSAAEGTPARVRVRESAMAENAIRVLEHRGPEARAVIWAHNAHIAGNLEAEPRMMGWHLRARLGPAYRAFGSAMDRGSYQTIDGSSNLLRAFEITPAPPGSLENTLAAVGRPIAIFDLRTAPAEGAVADWFRALQMMRQFDGLYDDPPAESWGTPRVVAAREYDALFFLAAGSTARRLPSAAALFLERPKPVASPGNLDLEDAEGALPRAWLWAPARDGACGYAAALDREQPFAGGASARISRTSEPRYGECPGRLRQIIDAVPLRGQRLRLRAAARVESAAEHAHLYLDSHGRRAAARTSGEGWRTVEAVLEVPGDAGTLELGLAFDGEGRAWFDAVSLTALPSGGGDPAR